MTFALYDFQRDLVERVEGRFGNGVRSVLMQLGTGGGKCLGLGTPVLRFDGTIVPVEHVRIGDALMGPDSTPRRVRATTRGLGEMFSIRPPRGEPWRCNDVHVLTLMHVESGDVIDVPLNVYLTLNAEERDAFRLFAPEQGVDFAHPVTLPGYAYHLGVHLAEGHEVPYPFRTASRDDRRSILAGLVDTARHVGLTGWCEIAPLSKRAAEDIAFVARSLGYRATANATTSRVRVTITGRLSELPLRKPIPERCVEPFPMRSGFSVAPLGVGEYAGFELDGDGRFLLASFVVTHNTASASEILRRNTARGERSIFMAHLDSLTEDTHERLSTAGITAGFVQAGRPSNPEAPVQVASLQTLIIRGDRPPADNVILDEAHRAGAAGVRALLEAYPRARILGLSATPQRGDGQPLDSFAELVQGPSNMWLTEHGYLVPCHVLAPAEYLGNRLWRDPVEAYQTETPGSRAIVFAANVAHAVFLRERFEHAGITAACLTGETPRAERRSLRERIHAGGLKVIIGIGVFLEGWDAPSVETAILARPFETCGAYLQADGRPMRTCRATGKTHCTILDLVGAVNLHGLPDEDRFWSLTGDAVRRADVRTEIRRCTKCYRVFRASAHCPRCGAESKQHAPKLPIILNRAEKLELYSALSRSERDQRYLAQLTRIALRRMRISPAGAERWALKQFFKRWQRMPEVHHAGE